MSEECYEDKPPQRHLPAWQEKQKTIMLVSKNEHHSYYKPIFALMNECVTDRGPYCVLNVKRFDIEEGGAG